MTSRDHQLLDAGLRGASRRDFLRVAGQTTALIALGARPARGDEPLVRFRADPFTLGVASGDPLPDGVVLWTRLARPALADLRRPDAPVPVRWEVADDEAFRRIARRGEALASPELGYSVHVEVEGLQPGRVYHYRFLAGGGASTVGRTRTAPATGTATDRLRLAFASCQQFEHGYYTAYKHLAAEDLDIVLHLGDYIYEKTWGDNIVRPHDGTEIFSLEDYRRRHSQYRGDPDLQAAHAAFPWAIVWDDHEVDNNYAGGTPEDEQSPEAFLLRRAAAYQAFYEFMPLRRASVPRGPSLSLHRRLEFGTLASLQMLDTRQFRDDQPCGDGNKRTCDAQRDPARTLLGAEQERWLLDGLRSSTARWNILGQQIMMARLMRRDAEGQPTFPMDMWDGYPAARQRVLDAFASGRVSNPIVLAGDIHSSWVNDLKADFDDNGSRTVGTEFVGTSITSGGDGHETTPGVERALAWNPHIRYYNGRRGYVRLDLTPERLTARYQAVPWVTQPGAPLQTRATFVVENGRPGAQRDT